ncbi:type II toxin-antitoxin system RelE family toxin [Candidatus Poriferisodalis sp.]
MTSAGYGPRAPCHEMFKVICDLQDAALRVLMVTVAKRDKAYR